MLGPRTRAQLPKKLGKEPLVEAIFEMRFTTRLPVSSIWPGILYSTLSGVNSMEQLPSLSIPKEIRDLDPNFSFVPVCRIDWGNYWILIGDRVFCVASKVPYCGWDDFKQHIFEAFAIVLDSKMIQAVERCSIKYVDIFNDVPLDPSLCFNLQLDLGGRVPQGNTFSVNIGVMEEDVLHTIQVVSAATLNILLTGQSLSGPVLDVDSVMTLNDESPEVFKENLASRAEKIHDLNKQIVFDSLSADALQLLEPTYE